MLKQKTSLRMRCCACGRIAPEWRVGGARITTWLYRVTANLCTDRLRKARGVALDAIPEPLDDAASVAEGMQNQSRIDALQRALDRLPTRQRQAVILRHIEGLANPEIAKIMEITTEAVESLIARGKRSLTADIQSRREEWGIKMTENHNENSELDKLLDEASKVDLYPSQQLLSRVLEEASAVQAEFAKAPIQPTHQGWIRELIRALGGWPSMAGLATATVTG